MSIRSALAFTVVYLAFAGAPSRGEPLAARSARADRHGDPLPPGAIARWGTVRFRTGDAVVDGLFFSRDGQLLYSFDPSGSGQAWRADNGTARFRWRLPRFSLGDVTPDGRLLAARNDHNTIRVVGTADGRTIRDFTVRDHFLDRVCLAPDGKALAVRVRAGQSGHAFLRIWRLPSGDKMCDIPLTGGGKAHVMPIPLPDEESADAVEVPSFSTDSNRLIARLPRKGKILFRRWDVASGREVPTSRHTYEKDDNPTLSPDGRTIAAVTPYNVVQQWAIDTGAPRLQFAIPKGGIRDLLFSPDGKRLLTAGHGRVLSWDARTGKAIHVPGASLPAGDKGSIKGELVAKLAHSPDGRLLAAVGHRTIDHDGEWHQVRELRLWERATGKLRWRFPDEDGVRRAAERRQRSSRRDPFVSGAGLVAFAPDGKTLAWNAGEAIELVDVVRGVSLRGFGSRADSVRQIVFSPTEELLAIAHADGMIAFIDPATGTYRAILDVPGDGLDCVAFSPDGRTLASGGRDTTILLWDVRALLHAQQRRQETPSAELEALWQRLADENGGDAAQAMAQLQDVPQQAVALLRKRLRPVTPVDGRQVGRLLDDLANDAFEVRQRATRELQELGDLAEPFLRKRLSEAPPLEMRRRMQALLEALEGFPTRPQQMRADRALEVLERLGTDEARALLRELASGAPDARLTKEAKPSLQRLSRGSGKDRH